MLRHVPRRWGRDRARPPILFTVSQTPRVFSANDAVLAESRCPDGRHYLRPILAGFANHPLMSTLLIVVRSHAESVLPLRIFFSVCLVTVGLAGVYVFKNRKKLFSRDPNVTGDHYVRVPCGSGRSSWSGFWR